MHRPARQDTMTGAELSAPRFSFVARVTSATVIASGVCVLLGWTFDVEVMKTLIPGAVVMLPNTAALFIVSGVTLRALNGGGAVPSRPSPGRFGAAVVVLFAAMMLVERIQGWNLGFDLLLFHDAVRSYPFLPAGLPATNTIVCFLLAGTAMLTLDWEPWRHRRPAQWMAIAGLMLSGLAVIGHLYGARDLYAFDRAGQMALYTALGFLTLHTGILFARPEHGGITLLTGNNLGSSLARRLIGATVAVPLLLGWIWLQARQEELISREAGIATLTVLTIAVLCALLLQAAGVLRSTDVERESLLIGERSARADAEAARALAEAANTAKGQFLATVSHELRTPLNAVIGYSSLMLDGVSGPVSDVHRHQLGRISLAARHLLALIDEILTLTRLDAGKEIVHIENCSVERLLHDSAAITEPLAQARNLMLRVATSEDETMIATDGGKVLQILVNLLGNAIKFTDTGEVALTAEMMRDGERAADVPIAGDVVCISVKDTGVGIASQHFEKVFDLFWQVEQTATRRAPGTGLGLSVSRRLARLLDGELTLSSEVGRGSTFRLWLPLRRTTR